MEKIALNNFQLDHLASQDPKLSQVFYRTVPCDTLPALVLKAGPTAYIVNTDPHNEPGRHWIALWTEGDVCEVMDSYGVSLDVYGTTEPIKEWINRHFKHRVVNRKTLQSIVSKSCGDYALMFLVFRARGFSMNEFLDLFSSNDFVGNDRKVGQWLRHRIVDALAWKEICETPCQQDTRTSALSGIYDLLHLY